MPREFARDFCTFITSKAGKSLEHKAIPVGREALSSTSVKKEKLDAYSASINALAVAAGVLPPNRLKGVLAEAKKRMRQTVEYRNLLAYRQHPEYENLFFNAVNAEEEERVKSAFEGRGLHEKIYVIQDMADYVSREENIRPIVKYAQFPKLESLVNAYRAAHQRVLAQVLEERQTEVFFRLHDKLQEHATTAGKKDLKFSLQMQGSVGLWRARVRESGPNRRIRFLTSRGGRALVFPRWVITVRPNKPKPPYHRSR